MGLKKLLEQEKPLIIKKWFELIIETYPLDAAPFLKGQKDLFANPVGNTFSQNLEALFNELMSGMNRERLISFHDPVIRIRAVQNFSPSEATAFILSLKKVIRKQFNKELNNKKVVEELLEFESMIDEIALLAFDIYMGCRETLYTIKANQEKTKVFKAFKRAGLVTEIADNEPDLTEAGI